MTAHPGSSRPVIVLAGVRQVFGGDVVALDGIDLSVPAHQFVALLGPSGCGKSTLLRLIAGLDGVTSGTVRVAAGTSDLFDPCERVRQKQTDHLAFVFQDPHLLPWRSVVANVELPLELRSSLSQGERRERAMAALERVRLTDAALRRPTELSGGMKMRVSIARALVTEPSILLLDEPFAALDDITRQLLDESLRDLWAQRKLTVVFVTHSIAEAVFLAERAVVLSKRPGHTVYDGAVDLPTDRPAAIRAQPAFAREMGRLYEALVRGSA